MAGLEFRPDRWLDWEGPVSPYEHPVFQVGTRVCLDKEIAFVQMKYVVASILERFKLEPFCTEKPVFVLLLTVYMASYNGTVSIVSTIRLLYAIRSVRKMQ
ncbi:cytochrome P450-like protein [Striga asiatica]|uniref:Cytochrome P450-like protein n=1 Tax=Striga asiatica TaxID=4170 RepID=A0A5A7RIQ4_STRAF|nr:cytochrome P450-like protein [Striga asiatica]